MDPLRNTKRRALQSVTFPLLVCGPCTTHTPKLLVVVAIGAHQGNVPTILFLDLAVAVSVSIIVVLVPRF